MVSYGYRNPLPLGMQTDQGIPATRGDRPDPSGTGNPALAGNGSGMDLDFLTRSGDGYNGIRPV